MEPLEQIFTQVGVPAFGACSFQALHPLLQCRAAQRLPENAGSVLVCLFPYYVGAYSDRNLSRYAMVDDYHTVSGQMLEQVADLLRQTYPAHAFACFTDSSPIREVYAAYLAGLGFIGKNGQLIHPRYGSYCFIGEIVTTLALPYAQPLESRCGDCMLCLDACPQQAIGERGAINTALCRSHITQKKGMLSPFEQESIQRGGFAWGCDICTDVCPWNHSPVKTPLSGFYTNVVHRLTEDNCEALCATRAFGWRGAGVLRRNLQLLNSHSKAGADVL